jgi:hypothetical protein
LTLYTPARRPSHHGAARPRRSAALEHKLLKFFPKLKLIDAAWSYERAPDDPRKPG